VHRKIQTVASLIFMKQYSGSRSRSCTAHSSPRFARRRFTTSLISMAFAVAAFSLSSSAFAQRGQLQLEFNNGSPAAVKLMQWNRNGSGKWEDHGFVPAGRVVYKAADSGTQWAFVNPSDNALIDSLTAGRFSRQLKIDARHFSGGGQGGGGAQGGHDDHDDHDDHGHGGGGGHGGVVQPILVALHASNHSSQALFLYRDGGSGSFEYVTTLQAGKEYKGNTPVNTVWAFVTPNGNKVIKKLTVNREHNDLEIHNQDIAPPAPNPQPAPKPQPVTITFRNLSGQTLEVYHGVPGKRGGHVIGTIRNGQQQVLQAPAGDNYAILRAADHLLVKSYQVPGRSSAFTISPQMMPGQGGGHGHDDHDDHGPGQGGGGGHDDHDDHGAGQGKGNGLLDPRELLRRILGGGN
jgi:hypothetical protein